MSSNPALKALPAGCQPSLARIHSIKVPDLESQDHILTYQVPVAIERYDVGLLVIDSITANFRAEFDRPREIGTGNGSNKRAAFAERNNQLIRLGAHLRGLAEDHNLAVVVANQVLDRFTPGAHMFEGIPGRSSPSQSRSTSTSQPFSPRPVAAQLPSQSTVGGERDGSDERDDDVELSTADPLSLDHQQRFTTGWGSISSGMPFGSDWLHTNYHRNSLKTPSLGQVWTSQLAARFVLLKSPIYADYDYTLGIQEKEIVGWRRSLGVVFSSWASETNGTLGQEVAITSAGIGAVLRPTAGVSGGAAIDI